MTDHGGNRLPILAETIKREHADAKRAAQRSIDHAVAAGEALIEAKAQLTHGKWLPWLKKHCELSERSAQVYMRLARHKDVLPNTQAAADLTIEAAVESLTKPKAPDKLSDLFRALQVLPPAGNIKIGLRKNKAGWDEVWVVPSYQHDDYYYVTHIWTPRVGNTSVVGTRRPVRADFVAHVVDVHLSCEMDDVIWRDVPASAWTFNHLLFDSPEHYVDSLDVTDIDEVIELADGEEPGGQPVPAGAQLKHSTSEPRPLCAEVFGIEVR